MQHADDPSCVTFPPGFAARLVVADPPWKFGDRLPSRNGAESQYNCLPLYEIQRFPLPPIADDAVLVLWRVSAMVEEAYEVVRSWGFVPKTELVWRKMNKSGVGVRMGMGRTLRNSHETAVVATRGRPQLLNRSTITVFDAPVGRHSEKPHVFYEIMESLTDGPRVELFSRKQRPGWYCFGNEVRL